MIRACILLSRKYSPIVQPVYGAKNCIGAESEALAATTVVYSIAPKRLSFSTTLATADRHQRVERLDPGLHWLVHALPLHDAGRLDLQAAGLGGVDRALAIERHAERAHHPAEQRLPHRHRGDLLGAADRVALADRAELAHDGDADVVLLEIEHEALHPVLELDQLAGEDALQAVDAGDAVALAEHGPGLGNGDLLAVVLDLLTKDSADLVGADFHGLVCRGRERFGDVGRNRCGEVLLPACTSPGFGARRGAGALPSVCGARNGRGGRWTRGPAARSAAVLDESAASGTLEAPGGRASLDVAGHEPVSYTHLRAHET